MDSKKLFLSLQVDGILRVFRHESNRNVSFFLCKVLALSGAPFIMEFFVSKFSRLTLEIYSKMPELGGNFKIFLTQPSADDPSPCGEAPHDDEDGDYWIGMAPLLDMSGTARVLGIP